MKKFKKILAAAGILCITAMAGTLAHAEPGYMWLEAEGGTVTEGSYTSVDTEGASGGKGMMVNESKKTESKVEFTFEVDEAASYDIKILTAGGTFVSKYEWKLDDGEFKQGGTGDGKAVYQIKGDNNKASDVKWCSLSTENLTAGEHTITIYTYKKAITKYIHYFDAIAVVPTEWNWTPDGINRPEVKKSTKANAAMYNFSELTNTNQPGVFVEGASVCVLSKQDEGTVYNFPVKFKAPKEGTYDLYFCGARVGADFVSPYAAYYIDGEDKGTPDSSQYYKNISSADGTGGGCGMGWYRLDRLDLDTEEHELSFRFDSPRSAGDYVIALRYLVLVPSDANLTFSDSSVGNIAEFVKYGIYLDGEPENITDNLNLQEKAINGNQITWSSSDESVVAPDGEVTRPGYYDEDKQITLTASFEACDRTSKDTFTKEFLLTVKKKEAYTVKNFALAYPNGKDFGQNANGGTLTASANISNNTNEEKDAILIIAMYDENGAMSAIASKECRLTADLQEIKAELPISEEKEGYSVDAFLWTDMGAKKIIQNSIISYTK